ncbi:MAG: hypothetical protein KDE55_23105, partial [Novosphingobium sp.]|nr:hypothetical protein [Novosphingobium sp.]
GPRTPDPGLGMTFIEDLGENIGGTMRGGVGLAAAWGPVLALVLAIRAAMSIPGWAQSGAG